MKNYISILLGAAISYCVLIGSIHASKIEPELADKSKVPYKYAAKLFWVSRNNSLKEQCSAQYVGASDVILTAAHCISDGNIILSPNQIVVLHGYTATTPLVANKVEQTVKCMARPMAYRIKNPTHDYAFLKMNAPGNYGQFLLGSGVKKEANTSIGYPSNFKKGKELMAVHGEREAYNDIIHGNVQLMKRNPFGFMASGGAWINSSKEVVGINAKIVGNPNGTDPTDNWMISPIFNDTFVKLFDYVNGGCSGANP